MNSSAIKRLREKLAQDKPTYGLWVTLESASITEMAVAMGLDWVVIDAEHGHLDWQAIVGHIRAAVRSNTVTLVRIAELNGGLIKRSLDIGADGVVVPWIETSEQLQQAVSFAHYPPQGQRGIGGERATCWGACTQESVDEANEHVLVVPIIESVLGGKNIASITRVDGVDMFFLGPADFSSTAGYPGEWEGGDVASQILEVKQAIRQAGKHCGIVATDAENLSLRKTQGFNMIGLGLDGSLMIRAIRQMMAAAGRDDKPRPAFTLECGGPDDPPIVPLSSVPDAMKPKHHESMNELGSGVVFDLAHGVKFECLVGRHNHAQQLTTGIVTFSPNAKLPYHTHPFSESVTLLSGSAQLEVEGRCYKIGVMDNVVLPRHVAHQMINQSSEEPAVFHVAMASSEPTRAWVDRFFSRRAMPDLSPPVAKAERINWFKNTPRSQAGPGATFMDWFNRDLMPGIEMCGGHGLFAPGGRLPCHIHDFDESISIIEGTATCFVDGKRYLMSDYSTALQPRGLCHYFINETDQPMVMIWVYAGPTPERIVMQDQLCSLNPSALSPPPSRTTAPTPRTVPV